MKILKLLPSQEGGGIAENGQSIRVNDVVAKYIYPTSLKDIDYDICFIASANYDQIVANIMKNDLIPTEKPIVSALNYMNWILVHRFVRFCDDDEEFKNSNLNVYEFVKKYNVQMYPYEWFINTKDMPIKVYDDRSCNMKYAIYNGKRIYYPKNYLHMPTLSKI